MAATNSFNETVFATPALDGNLLIVRTRGHLIALGSPWPWRPAPLGPYKIQSAIGAGGMGEVYKARDTRLDRTVAIKVLPPDARRRSAVPRAVRARSARDLGSSNHPHICTLYDVGRAGRHVVPRHGVPGGRDARRRGSTKGRAAARQALRYAIEIADALDRAHRHGIVHRDLKPGNIMLTRSGREAARLRFGEARGGERRDGRERRGDAPTMAAPLTAQGTILGTLQYMAPEQLEGEEADARTDIFAFGAVCTRWSPARRRSRARARRA